MSFRKLFVGRQFCLLGILCLGFAGESLATTSKKSDEVIVSKITFLENTHEALIHYADISKPDPLKVCPLETLPTDLKDILSQLVEKVRDSVSKMKKSQSANCAELEKRLSASQANIGSALAYQMIASSPIFNASPSGSGPSELIRYQNLINLYTQQATAINEMLSTATTMMRRECIQSLDDRIVIQRLIGQAISLGGLVAGGWYGVATAAGGQIIANLPLFQSDLDKAISVFQDYDQKSERNSFLCLFRQMQKTACTLFATQEDQVIQGLEASFQRGPVAITKASIETIRNKTPQALEDISLLGTIAKSSKKFMSQMGSVEAMEKGSLDAYQELVQWCSEHPDLQLTQASLHPKTTEEKISNLQNTCQEVNSFNRSFESPEQLKNLLVQTYWDFHSLKSYYESLRKNEESPLGRIANTWESMDYFNHLKKVFEDYRDSATGNQVRLNYRRLVKDLERSIAKTQFAKTLKEDSKLLKSHFHWKLFQKSFHDIRVQKRALIAMLDVCQTLDPTLVCLYIDIPETNVLQNEWKKRCVGPKSQLCQEMIRRGDKERLLENEPHYLAYFDSLCGTK